MNLSFIKELAEFIRQYLQIISFGITAVTVMLLGPYINSLFKNICSSMHWLIRYVIFILLCTIGYGFLSHLLYINIKKWLSMQTNLALVGWTIGIYLVLAWFAKRQKAI